MGGQVGACERAPQSIGEEERKGLRGCGARFFGVEEMRSKKIRKLVFGPFLLHGAGGPNQKKLTW